MSGRILLKNIFLDITVSLPSLTAELPEMILGEATEDFWQQLEFTETTTNNCACWCCGLFFYEKSWGIPIFTTHDTQIIKSPFTTSVNIGRNIIHLPASEITSNYLHPTNEIKCQYKIHADLLDGIHREESELIKYYGNFCTIFCAIKYLQETEEFTQKCKENYGKFLYLIYSKYCKKKIYYIPPALPKTLMKIYCGDKGMTEIEFKSANKALEKQII